MAKTQTLFIGSDNLIKISNLVRKSFSDDEVIDDATVKMTLFRGNAVKLSPLQTNIGSPIPIMAGDLENLGGGRVGLSVKGASLDADDKILWDGVVYKVLAADRSSVIAEVQTIHPTTPPAKGSYRLGYKGEYTPYANEQQSIAVSATAGRYRLGFNGEETTELNEVQQVKLSGSPTGGGFGLGFRGESVESVNTKVELAMSGSPTMGSWTIEYDGRQKWGVPYNVSASLLQYVLSQNTSIGEGNIRCTGGPFPNNPITAEFVGDLAGQPVPASFAATYGTLGGGTGVYEFTATVSQEGSVPIAFDATPAEVEAALQSLSTIGAGNVACAGTLDDGMIVEFTGDLAGLDLESIILTSNRLTGGTSPSVAITNVQNGQGLPYNATAAQVQATLQALSTIGAGNVSCSPIAGGIKVEFVGDLSGQSVNLLTADDADLTGTVTITRTQAGTGLAYDSTPAQVKTALEALSTIEVDDIAVSGLPLSQGDMIFTFDESLADAPALTFYSSNISGVQVVETVKGRPEAYQTKVTVEKEYLPRTFAGTETVQEVTMGAVDKGEGTVGIPSLNNGLKAGDTVRIWGTINYDGTYEVVSATSKEFVITATFVEENFTGNEYFHKAVPGAVNITFTPTPEEPDGNYSGILPDSLKLIELEELMLEIFITKDTSDLLSRFRCMAIFHPDNYLQ